MTRISLQRLLLVSGLIGALTAGPPAASVAETLDIGAAAPGDPVLGQALYEAKCGGCHSLDANRVGPMHRGVVGRRPGSVAGYPYSDAVKALDGVWSPERLDLWLQGPQAFAPGTKMSFSVIDPIQRQNIIAYLASISKH